MLTKFLKIAGIAAAIFIISASSSFASKGVILNFNDVDISTMVKFISDLTGKNFIMDDRVKGKISVYSPSKLSVDEAYNVFVSVLELKGFTVMTSGKVLKLLPVSSAKQSAIEFRKEGEKLPLNESYVAQVIRLNYVSAQELMGFLQPMVSKDGHLSVFGPGNMLLLVDSALNIKKILELVDVVDNDKAREGVELIFLKNAAAETTAAAIRQWIAAADNKAASSGAGAGSSGNIIADQRLNALIIFGNEKIKKSIRDMIQKLDVIPPEASNKINVYYLEHVDATEMAKVLDSVVKGTGAGTAPPGTPQPQSAFDSGKITITPDKTSNSLIIMASPADYSNILQIIKKLDRRNKQVFVQVLIAEISLDKARDLGVESSVIAGYVTKNFSIASFYDPFLTLAPLLETVNQSDLIKNNPNIKLGSPANMAAAIKAMDSKGLINVLSTPNILTSDNKEAEIFVGENVPFLGKSNLTGTSVLTQDIERKDTGISLKIKPQISEGEFVRLDLNQEISAVKEAVTVGTSTDRITTKRSAKTSITVKDQETVVIGGLIQERENEIESKVPFLGDLPALGWLFKTKSKKRDKTNLMILLTPRIMKDDRALNEISREQRDKFGKSADDNNPVDARKEISGSDGK